jgi:hypothetical protein
VSIRSSLDHPIFFTFAVSLCVMFWLAVITWGAKAAGIPGLAALAQHP